MIILNPAEKDKEEITVEKLLLYIATYLT